MKLAMLACLAALCLIGPSARAASGESGRTEKAPQPDRAEPVPARTDQPRSEPAKTEAGKTEPGKTETGKTDLSKADPAKVDQLRAEQVRGAVPTVGARERRRRSYAACNRASHLRDYRGGRRRRFLIRCRLGYERTRGPQTQSPAAPPSPGRKP